MDGLLCSPKQKLYFIFRNNGFHSISKTVNFSTLRMDSPSDVFNPVVRCKVNSQKFISTVNEVATSATLAKPRQLQNA